MRDKTVWPGGTVGNGVPAFNAANRQYVIASNRAQADALARKPGYAGESYTDYIYQVQVRVDSDSGELTAFVFDQDSGEIGKPIRGGTDLDIAHSVGRTVIEDARREEHGWEPAETLEDLRGKDIHLARPPNNCRLSRRRDDQQEEGGMVKAEDSAVCIIHGSFYSGYRECPACKVMTDLCEDCPPRGYPTDDTRCRQCPNRSARISRTEKD